MTGAHLVEKLGNTYQEIERDGIKIYDKIPINTEGNTSYDISCTMANAILGFSKYFRDEKPDLLIILGDRTEILAICVAAVNEHVPIAHIHGGELTFGLIDEYMRHAITKMSCLHFASTSEYQKRIIQMGEQPEYVYNVGALGVENVWNTDLMTREGLGRDVGFPSEQDYAVVTFQPVTLDWETVEHQVEELFSAMLKRSDLFYLITKANADEGGDFINQFLEIQTAKYQNMKLVASLGMKRYLTAVKYARFVLGNSSSGIIEAPSLGTPTVNVGDRQKGRIMANSIVNCEPECQEILMAIEKVMGIKEELSQNLNLTQKEVEVVPRTVEYFGRQAYPNPYGNGNTSEKIIDILKKFFQKQNTDLKKKFYDIV
ncbi:UDP-N-acetylglucosamine 2-epimerase [Lachnospiraceae bacterium 29-84]